MPGHMGQGEGWVKDDSSGSGLGEEENTGTIWREY